MLIVNFMCTYLHGFAFIFINFLNVNICNSLRERVTAVHLFD